MCGSGVIERNLQEIFFHLHEVSIIKQCSWELRRGRPQGAGVHCACLLSTKRAHWREHTRTLRCTPHCEVMNYISVFFFKNCLFILCIWVLCSCLQTHQKRALDPITVGCKPSCHCWELNSGPLEEQSVLLTTEPSLQPNFELLNSVETEKHYRAFWNCTKCILCNDVAMSLCRTRRGMWWFEWEWAPKTFIFQYLVPS